MQISLKEKNIILIGASGTIGNSILEKLLQCRANVGATYNSNSIDTSKLENETRLLSRKMDITDIDEVKKVLSEFKDHFKRIDAVIYNSGICDDNLFPLMSYKSWRDVINVNLDGAFISLKCISKVMIKQKFGKIITIASSRGSNGSYGQCNYSASKAGLIGFTKSLAKDLGKFNISVNAVCPGFMVTNLNKDRKDKENRAYSESVLSKISYPEETANFIAYFVSDFVKTISGQVFNIDSRL